MVQTDLEQLVFNSLDMAQGLLIELEGEFYPFGGYIDNKGAYKNVGLYEGDDFPLSETVIDGLKNILKEKLNRGQLEPTPLLLTALQRKRRLQKKRMLLLFNIIP